MPGLNLPPREPLVSHRGRAGAIFRERSGATDVPITTSCFGIPIRLSGVGLALRFRCALRRPGPNPGVPIPSFGG